MLIRTLEVSLKFYWASDTYKKLISLKLPMIIIFSFAIPDLPGARVGSVRRSIINDSIYAELLSIDHGNRIITSTFHIKASLSSFVNCTATDDQNRSTIHMRIPGKFLSNMIDIIYPCGG